MVTEAGWVGANASGEEAPDKYDVKAARVHGRSVDAFDEDDDLESSGPLEVVIVGLQIPFDDVLRLLLQIIAVQCLFVVIVGLALYLLGVF